VLVLTGAGAALLIALVVQHWDLTARGKEFSTWLDVLLTMIPLGLAGALLIDRRPDLPFGWLLGGAAVSQTVFVALVYPAVVAVEHGDTSALPLWLVSAQGLAFLPVALQGIVNVRFPSGRLSSRRGRVLELAIITGTALALLSTVFGSTSFRGDSPPPVVAQVVHPLTGGTAVGTVFDAFGILAPVVVLLGLIAGIGVVVRCVKATGVERQQLKWRATGVVVSLLLFPFAVSGYLGFLNGIDATVFVLTIIVPVLRYRLWAIDTIVRRSVAYTMITAILIGVYAAVTALVASVASARVGAPIGAAAAVIAFGPVRDRTQHLVRRMFYGRRDDPYVMLTELGRRLESTMGTGEVLPAVVDAIGTSLRLPYVAIERPGDGTALATYGERGPIVEAWPLSYEGVVEGHLVASPRRGEQGFDERDREVLGDVARHAGVAVHAEALTADLLASRQRLVTAREEERRRLRRDLHDGLGPVLTGIGLNLDAARARLAADPQAADEFIAQAKEASAQAIADLRQLVYGLRPPALDDLGLVGAVRAQAERLSAGTDLRVELDCQELPVLPAAVEVAAFRTAVEAVHNAVRHGHARHCAVRLVARPSTELVVEIDDDGTASNGWRPGVGLTAMRERAEELGGTLTAGPASGGGARVVARFPLVEAVP
jgi:signal transduction histidine kinase